MTPLLVCLDFTECLANEYEALAPSPTLDRICEATATCSYKEAAIKGSKETMVIGEWETAKPDASSDRECGDITLCDESTEYERAAPELADSGYPDSAKQALHVVADRICGTVSVCDNVTEYETKAATRTSDRACAVLSAPCDPSTQYESVPPSENGDRECTKFSRECRVGEFQEKNATATNDRVCTVCKAGTIDHDEDPLTKCAVCPGGSFQDRDGQSFCRDSTQVCPAGTFEVIGTNASTARVCEYCNGVSEYNDQAGQSECKQVSECEPGTFVAGPPTAKSDRICEACDGVTEYQDKLMAPSCIPVSAGCGYGHFQKFAPQPDADRVCLPCPDGMYQDELFQSECKEPTQCIAGTAEFAAVTAVTDRICVACDGVSGYQDEDGASECKKVSTCNVKTEFVKNDATPTTDTVCRELTRCPEDTFHEIGSGDFDQKRDRMCTSTTACQWPEEYEFQAPTSTTNRICARTQECRDNHFEVSPPSQAGVVASGGSGQPQAAKDRVCEKCTRCSSVGEWQSKACDDASDAECQSCTACESGVSFEAAACNVTSDRVCDACTECAGSEVDTGFGMIWVGEYASEPCTVGSDTTCSTCTHCRSWEYEESRCTATADAVCMTRCGYVEKDGEGDLVWNGKEFSAGGVDGVCEDLTRCVWKDQFELVKPTPDSDRQCQNFTTCEFPAMYEVVSASRSADRVCKAASVCSTVDGSEYEAAEVSPTSDRHCMPVSNCTDEQFEAAPYTAVADRDCKEKRICGLFEQASFEGNATADRVCVPLPEDQGEGEAGVLASLEEEQATASMSGSSQFLVFVAVVISLVALAVFYIRSGGVTMVSQIDGNYKTRGAGVVEADADVPFKDGDFWFVEESEVELAPMVHFLRQPPLGHFAANKSAMVFDDDEYYTDSESQVGEYILVNEQQSAVPQLLSHTLSPTAPLTPAAAMMMSSPAPTAAVHAAPPAAPPQFDLSQFQNMATVPQTPNNNSNSSSIPVYQAHVPAAASPHAYVDTVPTPVPVAAAAAAAAATPALGLDLSALGVNMDLGVVGTAAPQGGAAPLPVEDEEEDTKL